MNRKLELYDKLLCMGCLCVGHTLKKITQKTHLVFYVNSLSEIGIKFPDLVPSMCVECSDMLKKAVAFKEQIQNSYKMLQTYPDENLTEYLTDSTSHIAENVLKDDKEHTFKKESDINHIDVPENGADVIESVESDSDSMDVPISTIKREKMKLEEKENLTENSNDNANTILSKYEYKVEVCVVDESRRIKEEQDGDSIEITEQDQWTPDSEVLDKAVDKNAKKERKRRKLDKRLKEMLNQKLIQEAQISNKKDLEDDLSLSFDDDKMNDDFNDEQYDSDRPKQELKTGVGVVKRRKKKTIAKKKTNKLNNKKFQPFLTLDLSPEEMKEEREKERNSENYLKAEYKCDTCIVKFNYEKSYVDHMKKRHAPSIGDYVCPVCSSVFNNLDAFTSHYKRHMKRYECTICKKRTADIKVMHQHCYAEHNITSKQYRCLQCNFSTCSINALRYHKESHKSRVKCNYCDKTFSHRAGLINHTMAFHGGRNSFPCEVCGANFRWKASLKRHAVKHHVTPGTQECRRAHCAPCDISFSSVSSYQRHLKNSLKHVSQNDLKYICDHCKRRFADKTKLRDHIEEKHLFKTFHCHICNKPSKNRVGLDQHIRNVHKGRPNNKICHHCGKGFPTTMQLESHIRTHTGERPYICEYCPTTFSQHSNLYKHNRQVHLNMKSKRTPPKSKDKMDVTIDTALGQSHNQHITIPVTLHYGQDFVM